MFWRTGRHTPTKTFQGYPPDLRVARVMDHGRNIGTFPARMLKQFLIVLQVSMYYMVAEGEKVSIWY